jgi:hypothetical protein
VIECSRRIMAYFLIYGFPYKLTETAQEMLHVL